MSEQIRITDSWTQPEDAAVPVVDASMPRSWDGRIAYLLSQVFCPPVVGLGMIIMAASVSPNRHAWAWAGLYVMLGVLAPLVYLVRLYRTGQVSDLDIQIREQRVKPLIFTLSSSALACVMMVVGRAPALMITIAACYWVQMVLVFLITLRWKISVHCATAAGAAALVQILLGTPLPLLLGLPMMAWSRVKLQRHTFLQTIGGTVLGLAMMRLALTLGHGV